jgi:hypothetical protein
MESSWAAEHLQVIRTLMERSALYRRALAPIMIYNGVLGAAAGLGGWWLGIQAAPGFIGYWAVVAVAGLTGSFLLSRRQALKAEEPFWSPPTRRVAQALLPPLLVGLVAGLIGGAVSGWELLPPRVLPPLWLALYGCALNAAGFFMQRGMKLLGWVFILGGCLLLTYSAGAAEPISLAQAHWIMGAAFGGIQLAYGIYLALTGRHRDET